MECFRCKKKAEVEIGYSKQHLCRRCFLSTFEKRIRKNIRVNDLLSPHDKTAVALSGGKDSAVTLYVLNMLHEKAPRAELVGISIDQGIKGGDAGLTVSKKLCGELGVEHFVFSFREEFGFSMDELMDRVKELDNPAPACSYCGVFRRKLLNDKARELGVSKIATGHNLDDEVQTALMNFIRGEVERMARMGSLVGVLRDEGFVPRIKPLRDSPEEEILLYAKMKDILFEPSRCPYSGEAFRKTMREVIEKIEKNHPGSRFQILKSTDRLIPLIRSSLSEAKIGRCGVCGDPASGRLCRVCALKKELGLD